MKKLILSALILAGTVFGSFAQNNDLRKATNNAFGFGEKIKYKVKYSLYLNVPVGEVDFTIKPDTAEVGNKKCYQITAEGKTYGFYDAFFKVRDKYETFMEVNSLLPLVSFRDVQEGGYKFNESIIFDHTKNIAKTKKKTSKIPDNTLDVVSSLYYARTLNVTSNTIGDTFYMNTFIDDSTHQIGLTLVGKETIKTDAGKFRCLKLKPLLIAGRIFKSEEEMTLWVTDDENHLPVRIESGISVGSIKADLAEFSNLKNPLSAKIGK